MNLDLKLVVAAVVVIHAFPSIASDPAMAPSRNADKSSALATYSVKTKSCSMTITAPTGGAVTVENPELEFASFLTSETGVGESFYFNFRCSPEDAKQYCTGAWRIAQRIDEPDPDGMLLIRKYNGTHPLYTSEIYAENVTAVAEPRPRELNFCFGDNNHTIKGFVSVGTEKQDRTQQAFKIIKTIKIIQ